MDKNIFETKEQMGAAAAKAGAAVLRNAIAQKGCASIIVATGASQFEMLSALVKAEGIDWSKVTMFHLDEYAVCRNTPQASQVLKEKFADKLPASLKRATP